MNPNMTLDEIVEMCSTEHCNIVRAQIHRKDGSIAGPAISKNARVNAGALAMATMIGSGTVNPFKYIGLSPTVLTPAAGDTALSGETTAAGLARALATYGGYTAPSALNGTATFTLTISFTNTSGSAVTINSIALFNAAGPPVAGTMLAEANLSAAQVLNNGDSLNLTYTITC